jgi:succinoglycan biosynthesis transport protein ExoP
MSVNDVYLALWRHRYFIVVMTVALVALTWFLTASQEKQYTASTTVRVLQSIQTPEQALGALQTGERLARTYARIAETSTIADQVYVELGRSVPLREITVDAEQVSDLELLSIAVTSAIPSRAARIANAVPLALNDYIQRVGGLDDRIAVVERAAAPVSPSSPNLKLNLAIALLLGLIFNSALALLIDALSDRVGDADDLERLTGYPVLATVPILQLQGRNAIRLSSSLPGTTVGGEETVVGRLRRAGRA